MKTLSLPLLAIVLCCAANAAEKKVIEIGTKPESVCRGFGGKLYVTMLNDAEPGDGPYAGLAIARAIAQIHYRSDESFQERFGRALVEKDSLFGLWDRFQVESYLDYHGEKLVRRFDANSYLVLNRAMDTHDLARGRISMEEAVKRISATAATASISTDSLYPPHQQSEIQRLIIARNLIKRGLNEM